MQKLAVISGMLLIAGSIFAGCASKGYEISELKGNEDKNTLFDKGCSLSKLGKNEEALSACDEPSEWMRSGASKAESYQDDKNQLILQNPAGNPQGGTRLTNTNGGQNWKDFKLTIEYKVVSGSFDIQVKDKQIRFLRTFNDEWQKYTLEIKDNKLKISGRYTEPNSTYVSTQACPIIIIVKPGDNIIIKELRIKTIQ